MYNPALVKPMRDELTQLGVEELLTADEVDDALRDRPGTVLVIVNSVCGCAAGAARPAVALALQSDKRPDRVTTVFAGQDKEATERARGYFVEYPPSSPSMALLKDGSVVHMIQRHEIEGKTPQEIATDLSQAFERHC